jgi:hypothetical protein
MSKKDHAIHNEHACEFLHKDGKYCDWVVTTAFYSALHYVQHEIFPKNIAGMDYNTFDKYYNEHYRNITNKPSKHVSTINLIRSELGDQVHENYNWLFGVCMNARYRNYQTHPFVAEECLKRLQRIKSFLKK